MAHDVYNPEGMFSVPQSLILQTGRAKSGRGRVLVKKTYSSASKMVNTQVSEFLKNET